MTNTFSVIIHSFRLITKIISIFVITLVFIISASEQKDETCFELMLCHHSEYFSALNNTHTIDGIRLVSKEWCDKIDKKREQIFERFPSLATLNKQPLKSSLLFNIYNEWCGITKQNGQIYLVFGNVDEFNVKQVSGKDINISADIDKKSSLTSALLGTESAFYISHCYIIPKSKELRVYTVQEKISACKKIYPMLLKKSIQIEDQIGCSPKITKYAIAKNLTYKDKKYYKKLFKIMYQKRNEVRCGTCLPNQPSPLCKKLNEYKKLLHLVKKEELDDSIKQKVISYTLKTHVIHRCSGIEFDTLPYFVDICANNNIYITNKRSRDELILGIDETNTEEILIEGNEHDWEKQYALVKQYAQSWLCKNDFVYHYHTDNNINTIFYVIGQNTSPNFRHKIYFPYPHLDIKDIFLQDKRVLIYLGNKEESGNTYLIVCSKKYLRDLYNRPCTGEDGWTNFDHIQQHSIKTLENENALLEALTDDTTMHCYQLPVQQPTLCWASINFIHKIKSKNIISRVQLTKDELRNIELLPEEYAQQLKKISVYMPQPKSWGDYGLRIFSAFWDYDLMDACFNSDGAHGKRPFFSDCVYGIAAICAGWSWPVLPVARIFGICGIARYILVGVGRRVGYDPFIDYNKGRYVSLLLQVYALSTPLQIAFATWEIQEQIGYGHLSKVTILAPWVWGLFDGLCMLDSNDSKYISCVYSEIWASKYAVLRRWYNNRKKM